MKKLLLNVALSVLIGLSIVTLLGVLKVRQEIFSALLTFPKRILVKILALLFLDYLLHAVRLYAVLRGIGYKVGLLHCFENAFFTIYFSFVTPMSIGGQPFQIYHLTKLGVKTYDATNVSVSRMFIGIFVVFFLDLIFISKVVGILRGTLGLTLVVAGFFISLLITILGLLVYLNKKLLLSIVGTVRRLTKSQRIREKEKAIVDWIEKMTESTKYLFVRSFWAVLADFILGVIGSAVVAYQLKVSIEALETRTVPLAVFWGVMVMLNSVVYYIPTPGSSGGIEGLYQIVFSALYNPRATLGGIVVYRLLSYYLIIFLGTVLIWRFTRFRQTLSQVRRESGVVDESR